MSLKKIVLALLIVNVGYFAYSEGWLKQLTGSDNSQREPERIAKQINPDAITVKAAPAFTKTLTPALAAVTPPESCIQDREQWMVYMGPYANTILRDKKKAELNKISVSSKDVSKAEFPIGLSLGQFDSEALAREEFKRLGTRGVRTASVILWGKTSVPCPSADKP